MFKKVGISLMAAMMFSSVALACNFSLSYDKYLECCFSLVDNWENKQESKQEERKVLKFDKEVVKKKLMKDGIVSQEGIDFRISTLKDCDPRMQNILDCYLANGTISDEVIDGISLNKVIENYGNGFWNGLVTMNIYLKKPNGAEELNLLSPIGNRFPKRFTQID